MKPITALMILDGFGCRSDRDYNAILTDGAAHIRALGEAYPHTQLQASGLDVGLWLWRSMSSEGFMLAMQKPISLGVGVRI